MTSPVPGVFAWPVIVAVSLVLVGRYRFLREGDIDRFINRTLAAAFAVLLLRESWFEYLLTLALPFHDSDVINIARQLSFGAILLTVSGIYGIAKLWAGAAPERAWQRQHRYDLVAILCTAILLIAGTPARRKNQLIDQMLGWPAVVAWTAFYLPVLVTAGFIIGISLRELRAADDTTTWRERAVYLVILGTGVLIGFDSTLTPVMTVIDVIRGRPSADPTMIAKALTFFFACVFACTVVAVPLISTLLTQTGWDRTGRYCRQLEPMWRDFTAAVPEVVLNLPTDEHGRIEPATRLHRMIVEIRDSLLHLKHYHPRGAAAGALGDDPRVYAHLIREAIDAKTAGYAPTSNTTMPATPPQLAARDLSDELEQLLALAKAWRHAETQQEHQITRDGRIGAF